MPANLNSSWWTALFVALLATLSVPLHAQVRYITNLPDAPSTTLAELQQAPDAQQQKPEPNPSLGQSSEPQQNSPKTPPERQQPKRILFIIPNYRAVSAGSNIAPLDASGKFKLMIDDSFDYSAFIYTGFVAGLRFAANSYPELGHGAAGYGQYYWRSFADQAIGDGFTEFLLPVVFKQDPRYFTKGHGGFLSRTGYALSRSVVTRSDKGTEQFNISELAGNLAAAGISEAYYPAPERGVSNTMNNWVVQLGLDAGFNVLKEFWPDIAHNVLRQKD